MKERFYITTPIYYANGAPHIGHFYTTIIADTIAIYNRLIGNDVFFLTGMDEHGQKVAISSEKNKKSPQEYVDEIANSFLELFKISGITNDKFIRTTEKEHKSFVIDIWNDLYQNEYIYIGTYSGWYSERDEAFYNESELINGIAPTGATVVFCSEECYFFKLSLFENKILQFLRENPTFIEPQHRINEIISFVKSGLNDICISRKNTTWGIPVPQNQTHTMYVWIDALLNYASALKNGFKSKYWAPNLQIMGKDILRFHAVYWLGILMALDVKLPKKFLVHGWWLNNGEKMSKSLGNIIDPFLTINKYGVDYVRYFMLKDFRFGNDGNFIQENLIKCINADLANNIGNLLQRVVVFVIKYMNGNIKKCIAKKDTSNDLLKKTYKRIDTYKNKMDDLKLQEAICEIINISEDANKYINDEAPWKMKNLVKDIEGNEYYDILNEIMYVVIDLIRIVSIMLQPFIPMSSKKILSLLINNQICNKTSMDLDFITLDQINVKLEDLKFEKDTTPIFPKIEK